MSRRSQTLAEIRRFKIINFHFFRAGSRHRLMLPIYYEIKNKRIFILENRNFTGRSIIWTRSQAVVSRKISWTFIDASILQITKRLKMSYLKDFMIDLIFWQTDILSIFQFCFVTSNFPMKLDFNIYKMKTHILRMAQTGKLPHRTSKLKKLENR